MVGIPHQPIGPKRYAPDDDRDLIKNLIADFDCRHLSKLRSGTAVRRQLDLYVIPAWGARKAQSIGRRDVIDLLDAIADEGKLTTANRVRSYVAKFLGWLVERDVLQVNPAQGVKRPAKEVARERVLSDDEVRWLWAAADAVGEPWGPFAKVLLLTGQRLREVSKASDAEMADGVWHLAGSRVKNGRPHDVPLSDGTRAVLGGVTRIADGNGKIPYIFSTTGRSPISGFFKAQARLIEAMEKIATKEQGRHVTVAPWVFHDLRRTAATGMARLGIAVRVTEAVLNHVSGTGSGIVAVYQRHDHATEKKAALEAWAQLVMRLVDGKAPNVLEFSSGRGA